jgi:hypothetical protein
MDSADIEFGGVEVEETDGRRVVLIGRNFGGELRLGAQFTAVYQLVTPPGGNRDSDPYVRANERDVCLSVSSIWAYGHNLDFLSPGMTARLSLEGDGVAPLQWPDVLGLSGRRPDVPDTA